MASRLALVIASVAALGLAARGEACSMCRCGDATFNALGRDGYAAVGLRLALDWERFEKDEGDPALESESQVENRFTALASYGFSDRFTLVARLPYSERRVETRAPGEAREEARTNGLSDPEVYARVQLWASPFRGELGRRASLSASAGVKLPWGENDLRRGSERVDEHAQPGTGSTDFLGNFAFLYLLDQRSAFFASLGFRRMGENDFGYRYGDVLQANLAYERKLGERFDGLLELDFRAAGRDRVDAAGTRDADTGGRLLYLAPRVLVDLGHDLVLRAGAQIPLVDDLNGFQRERTVLNLGITYLLRP